MVGLDQHDEAIMCWVWNEEARCALRYPLFVFGVESSMRKGPGAI